MEEKIIEQQQTIKGLQNNQESLIKIMKEYEDYKIRVDKTIEYIEKIKRIDNSNRAKNNMILVDSETLLKILKGEK